MCRHKVASGPSVRKRTAMARAGGLTFSCKLCLHPSICFVLGPGIDVFLGGLPDEDAMERADRGSLIVEKKLVRQGHKLHLRPVTWSQVVAWLMLTMLALHSAL